MPEEIDEDVAEDLPGEPTDVGDATVEVTVEEEMRSSYIDYAMSVIVGRALPDVRDGFKPVHRRILYAMDDMGLNSDGPHRKSARVVGEVLGKYHPHGDTAAYDTLVRMAQEFSLRYPLVDGQGNFGSMDGDSPAAMRYTEARLTPIAEEMLADIDEDTVDFTPNFDASMEEPTVLPGKLPNLLVNGSAGIAVGMATNMAPHNLGEIVDALVLQLDDPDVSIQRLMQAVPGPDFPTGGIIQGTGGIQKAYATGRGIVRMRARMHEEDEGGRLVATEIPYQVNKAKLAEDIAQLVRDGKLEGISDLRDESSREGVRLIIELKRGANPEIVKNQLFQKTQLQDSFGINNVALVDNEPKVLNLKELLQYWIEHRLEVIVRRTQYRLDEALDRAHIVEGLLTALRNIDDVIETIRAAEETADAREALIADFELTEEQARAILRMRLSRLTRLEQAKLEDELEGLREDIERYRNILDDEERQRGIIKQELVDLKEDYDDERRTEIRESEGQLVIEDLVPDDPVVILRTDQGYVKRVPLEKYRVQRRGGRGVIGMETKEGDHVVDVLTCTNHDRLLFLTEEGIAHDMKAYQVPEGDRYARGSPVQSLFERWDPDTDVEKILPVDSFDEDRFLFFATRQGKVKKTPLDEYERINVNGKIAIRLEDGDRIVDATITDGDRDIVLVKTSGKGLRFPEKQVRPMGRVASGVKGTELRGDEEVVGLVAIEDPDETLLTVTRQGQGKRTPFSSYRPKNRGAWGIYMHDVAEDETGPVVAAVEAHDGDEIVFTSREGVLIRSLAGDISRISSGQAMGVIVQRLEDGDETVAVSRLTEDELGALEDAEDEADAEEAPATEA
ncbi:DNA gyrase subunit A [Thermoplasmatales archaeon SW_10_69_26]|nr:MAG: DNA gyrase subunit A [Thermoplasmatales archaeon SW_10_69_26]